MPRESDEARLERMLEYERELWAKGLNVAGIDEVGRGPLAGPVVTCCIIVPQAKLILGVNDSKKVAEKKRERLHDELLEAADYVKTGWRTCKRIDEVNILNATKEAMEDAAADAVGAHFLIDAVKGLKLPGESTSIIQGDAKCFMIAAASIVAKVERDRYMQELDAKYPEYGFAKNKGYGTAEHIAALKKYGPCPEHRLSFIQNILGGGYGK